MKVSSQHEKSILALTNFSEQLAKDVGKVFLSLDQLDRAYLEVNEAINSCPGPRDEGNVVRRGLMENILRRDMLILLEGLGTLKETIAESVRLLFESGTAVLSTNLIKISAECDENAALNQANVELQKSLGLLEELRKRLHKT